MQRCTCTVRLGGDLGNTVELTGVSPAEVLILRHVHGDDAVVGFRPGGNDRGQVVDERGRLTAKYRGKLKEVFPGASAKLPDSFKDIGIDLLADDDTDDAKPTKATRGKGKDKGKGADKDSNPDSGDATATAVQAVTAGDLPAADADATE